MLFSHEHTHMQHLSSCILIVLLFCCCCVFFTSLIAAIYRKMRENCCVIGLQECLYFECLKTNLILTLGFKHIRQMRLFTNDTITYPFSFPLGWISSFLVCYIALETEIVHCVERQIERRENILKAK